MKVGDLVNITQQRGIGSYTKIVPMGTGIVLEIIKTPDVTFTNVGTFNLGDNVIVQLSSGDVKLFCAQSLEVINEDR